MLLLKNWIHLGLLSTANRLATPREINSKEIFPVPAHRSNTFFSSKSKWFSRTLKSPSFAKSVVGRDGKLGGVEKRLPLRNPLIMRTRLN